MRFVLLVVGMIAFGVPSSLVAAERPRLVILLVFDQMRGDYPVRWQELYGPDGFKRLMSEGAWYSHCHYPYGCTQTGPGHCSILTGCGPDTHGIIANSWYDRKHGATVNCSESDRYKRVPASPMIADVKPADDSEPKSPSAATKAKEFGTPERSLAPTVGDALKQATGGKGKVIGLSFKDRSAVLPTGGKADAAYWLDHEDGLIVTSSFYRDAVHPWIAEFNRSRTADRWFGKNWERFRSDLRYDRHSGPDNVDAEGKGSKQGNVFPHPIDGGLKRPGKAYYDAVYNSPYGNELLFDLVRSAVAAEQLGRDEVPDLLSISFSSNDAIGHCWGPDSHEVMDVTLRTDRLIGDLLKYFDETVGRGKYLVCMTADHGICPLPEVSIEHGRSAGRWSTKKALAALEDHLEETYGLPQGKKNRWVEAHTFPWVYLNHSVIAAKKLTIPQVTRTAATFLARLEGVERTITGESLAGRIPVDDQMGRRMQGSYFADRSGDFCYVLKPYWIPGEERATGTTHGSPHAYDTHVPLFVFGPNVVPGERKDETVPAVIAAIMAESLGFTRPARAVYDVPKGLFQSK